MTRHDELAVPERQLKPPTPPKAISLNSVLKCTVKCDKHGNPLSVGRLEFTVHSNGAIAGEAKLKFIGCPLHVLETAKMSADYPRRTPPKQPRVEVTCTKCGTRGTTPAQNRNHWVGGRLCYSCQIKRANQEYRSGGNYIEQR